MLEVNDHPSLNIYFDSSKEAMGQREMTDEDICQVDLYVKSRLVKDVIMLTKKKRDTVAETPEFGSLTQIHPDESLEGTVGMYNLVHNLRQVFYNLCKRGNKAEITSQLFEKLYMKPIVQNSGI